MKILLSQLQPHPLNSEIYDLTDLDELQTSLSTNGQLEPIVCNKQYVIISGHRRFHVMKRLGWEECEVRITDYENETIALIEHNQYRVKTVSVILNESRFLEREYKKKIGQGRRTDLTGTNRLSTVRTIADKLGLSLTQLKKVKSIYNYEPSMIDEIDKGDLSVNAAYEIIREKHLKNTNGKQNGDTDFRKLFSQLLRNHEPDIDTILGVMSTTYPYSLMEMQVKSDPKLEDERGRLIEHMNFLRSLDAREEVIYRKSKEIQRHRWPKKKLAEVHDRLWTPTNIRDSRKTIREIEELEPYLETVDTDSTEFRILRVLTHSQEFTQSPGRFVRFIVRDRGTDKYLGILVLASDFTTIEVRDHFIGWTDFHKFKKGHLRNTSVLSSCSSVQPFGFNFNGGKLLAALATTEPVRSEWLHRYKDPLVGITTTALYGSFSMYNSIPMWKKLGESTGKMYVKPDDEFYKSWVEWLQRHHPEELTRAVDNPRTNLPQTSPKQNTIKLIFRYLGISPNGYMNNHRRGVYFSQLYKNTREFLRDEITGDQLIPNPKCNHTKVVEWWKEKAIGRYRSLKKGNKLEKTTLWYENMNEDLVEAWLSSRGVRNIPPDLPIEKSVMS